MSAKPGELLDFEMSTYGKSRSEKLDILMQLFNTYGDARVYAINDENFLAREDYAIAYGLIEREFYWLIKELRKDLKEA